MTLEDKIRLSEEAAGYANDASVLLSDSYAHWLEPGQQALALKAEHDAREAAKRAAILLETIARE